MLFFKLVSFEEKNLSELTEFFVKTTNQNFPCVMYIFEKLRKSPPHCPKCSKQEGTNPWVKCFSFNNLLILTKKILYPGLYIGDDVS